MRITLHPENDEDVADIRSRAAMTLPSGLVDPSSRAVAEACIQWAAANPPKPGPGSVLRCNGCFGKPLRIVTADGRLMDTVGRIRCDESWSVGTGQQDYTIVYEHTEKP